MHLKVNGAYKAAYGGLKVRVVNQYRHVTRLYKKEDGMWREIDMWASIVFKMKHLYYYATQTTPLGFVMEFYLRFGADTPIVSTGKIDVSLDGTTWGQTITAPAGQTTIYAKVTGVTTVDGSILGTVSMPKGSVTRWGTADSADDITKTGFAISSVSLESMSHAKCPKIWVDTRIFSSSTEYITQGYVYNLSGDDYTGAVSFSGILPSSLIGLGLHGSVNYYGSDPLPEGLTYCHMSISYWNYTGAPPSGLTYLYHHGAYRWKHTGQMPTGLTYMSITGDTEWIYSGGLPTGLEYLRISGRYIDWNYNGALPSGLTTLILATWKTGAKWEYNGALPSGLTHIDLNCKNIYWTHNGSLPSGLTKLAINGCNNTSWVYDGSLPSGLTYLSLGKWKTGAYWTYNGALPSGLTTLSLNGDNVRWKHTGALPLALTSLGIGYTYECSNVDWEYTGALPSSVRNINMGTWKTGARWTYNGPLPSGLISASFAGTGENVYWSCSGSNPVSLNGSLNIYNTNAHITLDTSGYYPPHTVQMSGENPNLVWVHTGPLYASFYSLNLYGAGINFNVTSPIQGQSSCYLTVSNNATFVYSGVTGNIKTLKLRSPNANVSLPSGLGGVNYLVVDSGTTFTMPATLPSGITYLKLDGDGITWDNASGLPRGLTSVYLKGQNINWRGWGAQQAWTCAVRNLSNSDMYIDVGNSPIPTVAEVNSFIVKLAAIASKGNATSTRTVTLKNTPTVADGVNITPLTNKGYNVILGD